MNEFISYYRNDRTHLGWTNRLPSDAKRPRAKSLVATLSVCRGSAACTIDATSLREASKQAIARAAESKSAFLAGGGASDRECPACPLISFLAIRSSTGLFSQLCPSTLTVKRKPLHRRIEFWRWTAVMRLHRPKSALQQELHRGPFRLLHIVPGSICVGVMPLLTGITASRRSRILLIYPALGPPLIDRNRLRVEKVGG